MGELTLTIKGKNFAVDWNQDRDPTPQEISAISKRIHDKEFGTVKTARPKLPPNYQAPKSKKQLQDEAIMKRFEGARYPGSNDRVEVKDELAIAYESRFKKPLDEKTRRHLETQGNPGVRPGHRFKDDIIAAYKGTRWQEETAAPLLSKINKQLTPILGDMLLNAVPGMPAGKALDHVNPDLGKKAKEFAGSSINPLETAEGLLAGDDATWLVAPLGLLGAGGTIKGAKTILQKVLKKEISDKMAVQMLVREGYEIGKARAAVARIDKPPYTVPAKGKPPKVNPNEAKTVVPERPISEPPTTAPKVEPAATPKAQPDLKAVPEEADVTAAGGLSRSSRAIHADLYGTRKPTTITGKSHEQLYDDGKAKVDDGFDFEGEMESLAKAGRPATDEEIGTFAAGRDALLADLKRLNSRLDNKDASALVERDTLLERIESFDRNLDEVKGAAGRSLAALKIGHTVKWDDLDEVLIEARRVKPTELTVKDEARIADFVGKQQVADKRIADLEGELAKLRAEGNVATTRKTKLDKVEIQKRRQEIHSEIDAILKEGLGTGAHDLGSAAFTVVKAGSKLAVAAGKLAANYAQEGIATLDEIVERVISDFKARNIEIDRQTVIDEYGAPGTSRTKSDLEKQIADLKSQAKRQTTEAKAKWEARESAKKADAAAKIAARDELNAAKKAAREAKVAAGKAARQVEQAKNAEQMAKARAAKKDANANERTAWAAFKEQEKIVQRDFREQWEYQDKVFRTEEEIADLQNQLAEGRFRVANRREANVSKELEMLRQEKQLYASKTQSAVRGLDKEGPNIAVQVAKEASGLGKIATLGADMGALLRQGLHAIPYFIENPKRLAPAFANVRKAMKSEAGLLDLEMASIGKRGPDGRLLEPVRKKAGLSRASVLGNQQEEGYVLGLVDKLYGATLGRIPKLKGAVGSLGRGQQAWLNTIRDGMFDDFAIRHADDVSAKELEDWGSFINSAFGRSSVYGTKRTPTELAQIVLTSPRYESSRWEMVGNWLTSPATAVKAFKDKAARAKIINMASTAATVLGTLKITAAATGGELDLNPESSDFLKLRLGDKVIDLTAGISPRLRGVIRFMYYVKDPEASTKYRKEDGEPYKRNETLPKEILSASTRPVGPAISGGIEELTGYSISGWREEEGDPKGLERLLPLIIQGFNQDRKEKGLGEAVGNAAIEFLGGSVQRYKKPGQP